MDDILISLELTADVSRKMKNNGLCKQRFERVKNEWERFATKEVY